MIYVSLDELKSGDVERVEEKLLAAQGFNKVIVNAVSYEDITVFAEGLRRAMQKGRNYMIRCAAAIPKVGKGERYSAFKEKRYGG